MANPAIVQQLPGSRYDTSPSPFESFAQTFAVGLKANADLKKSKAEMKSNEMRSAFPALIQEGLVVPGTGKEPGAFQYGDMWFTRPEQGTDGSLGGKRALATAQAKANLEKTQSQNKVLRQKTGDEERPEYANYQDATKYVMGMKWVQHALEDADGEEDPNVRQEETAKILSTASTLANLYIKVQDSLKPGNNNKSDPIDVDRDYSASELVAMSEDQLIALLKKTYPERATDSKWLFDQVVKIKGGPDRADRIEQPRYSNQTQQATQQPRQRQYPGAIPGASSRYSGSGQDDPLMPQSSQRQYPGAASRYSGAGQEDSQLAQPQWLRGK